MVFGLMMQRSKKIHIVKTGHLFQGVYQTGRFTEQYRRIVKKDQAWCNFLRQRGILVSQIMPDE